MVPVSKQSPSENYMNTTFTTTNKNGWLLRLLLFFNNPTNSFMTTVFIKNCSEATISTLSPASSLPQVSPANVWSKLKWTNIWISGVLSIYCIYMKTNSFRCLYQKAKSLNPKNCHCCKKKLFWRHFIIWWKSITDIHKLSRTKTQQKSLTKTLQRWILSCTQNLTHFKMTLFCLSFLN